jgi:hypothetical protein
MCGTIRGELKTKEKETQVNSHETVAVPTLTISYEI